MKKILFKLLGSYLNTAAVLFPKYHRSKAFKLLCKVNRTAVSSQGQAFFDAATTTYVTVEDTRVAVHKWGTGSKQLLFLHGWMSYSYRWKPYIDQLDLSEFTVYTIDAPGHGLSSGKTLHLEMYRKAVSEVINNAGNIDTLICHSLGSLVGAYTFLENEDVPINNYVMMGAPADMDAILDYFKQMLQLSSRSIQNLTIKANEILKVKVEAISMANFFQKTKKPILVIHELSDRITPVEPIKQAVEGKENIQAFYTTGQDHNLKEPETIDSVIAFIQKEVNTVKKETTLCI